MVKLKSLTVVQAAEPLGISIPTVGSWLERGTLDGELVEGCWLVAGESVERILRVRRVLQELDREGNPSLEEIRDLYALSRQSSERRDATSSEA
jgi:hypothetical protein